MATAFISHSSQDDRYVQELVQFVRQLGFDDVFNDSHTIAPDELFWNRIEEGIRDCDAFVVLLSHASVKSYWVNREVQFARGLGKKILPVRIDDCKPPTSFDGRDVIDLRQGRGDKLKLVPSRIIKHSPQILFGRDGWLDSLDAAWANPGLNIYTLVAWGGVGKTSLVAHWVSQRMAAKGWPGVERYFDWSFYSQGTGESRQTSSDFFIQEALTFFDDPNPAKGTPWERGERLAPLIRQHRTLLVLDGIEPLQYPVNDPQAGRLRDQALEALLQGLAADNPGLCVVTTREHLKNIESHATTEEKKLDKLEKEAAIALLHHLQIVGTDAQLEAAWKDAGGHALTLQLLGRFLADAHGGDIRRYKEVKFEEADLERQGRSAFKVMIAYERWLQSAGPERQRELAVLRLTGLFDRPIPRDCLQALRAEPAIPGLTDVLMELKETQWNIALKRLSDVDLLTVSPDAVDAHPLIREYFAKQLRERHPHAFREAHSRLFDHLCRSAPSNTIYNSGAEALRRLGVKWLDDIAGIPLPPLPSLEDLQPLLNAVPHGCLAERHQEACDDVYFVRIMRGGEFYAWRKLGASGACLATVAAFFDEPWDRVSPNLRQNDRHWLLNQTALYLISLGRLTEALQPSRSSLEIAAQLKEWRSASVDAYNLSSLELLLGQLPVATAVARQSISYADQSGDDHWPENSRSMLANVLQQSGQRINAGSLFSDAERTQQESDPYYALLYSVPGFQYCEWLLDPAERDAWQTLLGSVVKSPTDPKSEDGFATIYSEVERRASGRGFSQSTTPSLLDVALTHLTLARTGLIRAMTTRPLPQSTLDLPHVAAAANGLREAGQMDVLPQGLLTAGLYHFVRGDIAMAGTVLAQVQEIAERGPMPLYLADVHLYRARLFRDRAELARARILIEKHGYWRRKEELEDAEAVAGNWPS